MILNNNDFKKILNIIVIYTYNGIILIRYHIINNNISYQEYLKIKNIKKPSY